MGPRQYRGIPPVERIEAGYANKARKLIAEAQSIFTGKPVSAKYVRLNDDFHDGRNLGLYLVTYEVSEWRKGTGQRYATLAHTVWCDGKCLLKSSVYFLEEKNIEKVYIAESFGRSFSEKTRRKIGRIDGSIPMCPEWNVVLPIVSQPAANLDGEHLEYLYYIAIENELEELPSIKP